METNDPENRRTYLYIKGNVTKFVDIDPTVLRLVGTTGKEIRGEVAITPLPEYPFTIREIRARNGVGYSHDFRRSEDGKGWIISAATTRKTKARLFDNLEIRIDSPVRKSLNLRIFLDVR